MPLNRENKRSFEAAKDAAAQAFVESALKAISSGATVQDLIDGFEAHGFLEELRSLSLGDAARLLSKGGGEPAPPKKSAETKPKPVKRRRVGEQDPREKLPPEAINFYLQAGPKRTYQAVADHYGVSLRTVNRRAVAEGWKARAKVVNAQAHAEAEEVVRKALPKMVVEAAVEAAKPAAPRTRKGKAGLDAAVLEALVQIGRPAHLKEVRAIVEQPRGQVWGALNRLVESGEIELQENGEGKSSYALRAKT